MEPTTEQRQKMQAGARYWIVLVVIWLGIVAQIVGWFTTARQDAYPDVFAVLTRIGIAIMAACS